jgi:hypothetical protein|nr:MAG TPA: hypothetical protein [Crassvirales sp.]
MDEIYAKVAADMGIPIEVVRAAYLSQWQFIRNTIEALPLKEELSEEEFNQLRTSFNLPSLGKIYTTRDKVQRTKRKIDYLRALLKNAKD